MPFFRRPIALAVMAATIYGVSSLYTNHITGSGQHLAIAGQTEVNDSDLALFRSTFGLSATLPVRHLVPNSGSIVYTEGDIAKELLRIADADHADLLVVGRSTKVRHHLAGSLGRRLVGRRGAPIVVVVP